MKRFCPTLLLLVLLLCLRVSAFGQPTFLIVGPAKLIVSEGQSSNVTLQVISASPVTSLNYAPGAVTPQFVTLGVPQFTNTSKSGGAAVAVGINPLHDAAGNYTVTIRATTADGASKDFSIALTVTDTPSLAVTKWIDGSSGDWIDPKRWTAGVPTWSTVGVVDVSGKYTINLPREPACAGLICDAPDAVLFVATGTTFSSPVEIRAGTLGLGNHQGLALNRPVSNRGRIALPSRDVGSIINGSGMIENSGIIDCYPVGGGGLDATLAVPVTLTSAGKLLLSHGWAGVAKEVTVSGVGTIEVQSDGRLHFGGTPSLGLIVQQGMRLIGDGTLLMTGVAPILMIGDATTEIKVVLTEGSASAGVGTLTLAHEQTLTGSYDSPIKVGKGSLATVNGGTFNNLLTVAEGGTLGIANYSRITVNGKLLNQGKIALQSRDEYADVFGTGSIESSGVIEVYAVGGGAQETTFYIPMTVSSSGTLLLSGGWANIAAGSGVNLFGTVDIQRDGRLRFNGGGPSRDFIVQNGAQLLGTGTLRLDGSNRLVMLSDGAALLHVVLNEGSRVAGQEPLMLVGEQNLTGTYDAPVRVTSGANVFILDATFNNTVTIDPGGTLTVVENRSMHLNGELVNQGTVQLSSRDRTSRIDGFGSIENSGLIRVYPIGGGGQQADFRVPVAVNTFGKLLLDGGWANFGGTAFLKAAGTIDLQGDARLQFEGNVPARDFIVQFGAQLLGSGTLLMQGANRLLMEASASALFKISLTENSRSAGSGVLGLFGAQSLTGGYESPVRVEKDASVTVIGGRFTNLVTIAPGGTLFVGENQRMQLDGKLVNLGRLAMSSRDRTTRLEGAGFIENSGLIELYPVGGGGQEAHIGVPLVLTSSGTLLLSQGWGDIDQRGNISGSGVIQVQADGRLRFDADGPIHDLTVQKGMRLLGDGTLLMTGSDRLVMTSDAAADLKVVIVDSAHSTGSGTLILNGGQTISGTYDSPVRVAKSGVANVINARFNNLLTVADGGTIVVAENQSMTVNAKLLNLGKMALSSRDRTTVIAGAGSIENSALVEVYAIGGGGQEAQFRVPVTVTASGTLLLSSGWGNFAVGSSLNLFGKLDVRGDGRLRFDAAAPTRDFVVQSGAQLVGTGTLQLEGANRLVMSGASAASLHLALNDSSHLIGEQAIKLEGQQTVTGVYDAPVRVSTNANVTIFDATFNNSVTVEPGATLTVAENRSMHLNGKLVNFGTIQLSSRDRTTIVDGAGVIENSALLKVFPVGGGGQEAHFRVPVILMPQGKLVQEGGWANFAGRANLRVEGRIDLQGDSRLRFEATAPARDLTVIAGAQLLGSGTLLVSAANRLVMEGDASAVFKLALEDSARSTGPGTLSLVGAQNLTGAYDSPVRIQKDSTTVAVDATFNNLLAIEPGGTFVVAENRAMTINGKLSNQGNIALPSRDRVSTINGNGFIDNTGTIEIYPIGGGGQEAHLQVPVLGSSTGKFLLSGGYSAFESPGRLKSENVLEINSTGRLRFTGSSHTIGILTNRAGILVERGTVQIRRFVQEPSSGIDNSGGVCADEFANRGSVNGNAVTIGCVSNSHFPSISSIPDQRTPLGIAISPISFRVSDVDTSAVNLRVTTKSSNPSLIQDSGLTVAGTGNSRTISVTPIPGQTGSALVLVTVTDPEGGFDETAFSVSVYTVLQQNQAPVISVPGTQLILPNTSRALSGLSVTDFDAGSGELLVRASTKFSPITLGATDGIKFLAGANNSVFLEFTATLDRLNRALSGLLLQPFRDYKGPDTLAITVDDQGNSGSGGAREDNKTVALNIVSSAEVDSDGDGVSDAAELRAGTDPLNNNDFFGFQQPPKISTENLSLGFQTVPGKTYILQSLTLGGPTGFTASNLSTVKATTTSTTLLDPNGFKSSYQFYRVLLVENTTADTIPPVVAALKAQPAGVGKYLLNVSAQDNVGVVAVDFEKDGVRVGSGVSAGNQVWQFTMPDLQLNRVYQITAVARDGGGNIVRSQPLRLFAANPLLLSPANADGTPRLTEGIVANLDGSLPAVVFNPLAGAAGGASEGLRVQLPAGARVVVQNGAAQIQFTSATAQFSRNSPLGFASPLTVSGTAPHQLPLGPVSATNLAQAFGIDPTNGLPVRVFGTLPLLWKEGTLRPNGIRGAKFSLGLSDLPLPKDSVTLDDSLIELDTIEGVCIPLSGQFKMEDGSDSAAKLTVPASRPFALTVRPDGSLALAGRAELEFQDGPHFSVDLSLADPKYALQISAEGLHIPMLGSLADALPSPAAVPEDATETQLDSFAFQFDALDHCYRNFAAAASCTGDTTSSSGISEPPRVSSVLEAFAYAAIANHSDAVGLVRQIELFLQSSHSAAASRAARPACEYYVGLLRSKLALSKTFPDPTDAALQEARAAVMTRARQPDAISSLPELQANATCLLEVLELSQQIGGASADAELLNAVHDMIVDFIAREAARLGVEPGVTAPPTDSPIAKLDRFATLQKLREVLTVAELAQRVGVNTTETPLSPIVHQLAVQSWTLANLSLNVAQQANDYTAFTAALPDAVQVAEIAQSGIVLETVLSNPTPREFLDGIAARLQRVFNADLNLPYRSEDLAIVKQDLRNLTRLFRQANVSSEPWRAAAQRLSDRAETVMTEAFANLSSLPSSDLKCLLQVGLATAELRARFNFTSATSWETNRLPQLVNRFKEAGPQRKAWSDLNGAVVALLEDAKRLASLGEVDLRRLYLARTSELLGTMHSVASAVWHDTDSCRRLSPALELADMVLPGNILIDKASGALSYNRATRELTGAMQGELRLPEFDGSFTLANATFSSGGAFDLTAFGQLSVPKDAQTATITISPRQPFHVSFRAPHDLRLRGAAHVDVQGGPHFAAHVTLDDPLYAFSASATGLRFHTASNLFGYVPVLDSTAIQNLGPDLRRLFGTYLADISATAEPLSSLGDAPKFAAIGTPPDFSESVITISTDPLNASLNAFVLILAAPAVLGYAGANAAADEIQTHITPAVMTLVNDIDHESHRTAAQLRKVQDDFQRAAANEKNAARQKLMEEIRQAATSFSKILVAETNAANARRVGKLPQNGTSPGSTAGTGDLCTTLAASYRSGLSDGGTLDDAVSVTSLLSSINEYVRVSQALGCSDTGLESALATFVTNARARNLSRYGFNSNGDITDAARFNALTDAQLDEALNEALQFEQAGQLVGVDTDGASEKVARAVLQTRREHLLVELKTIRQTDYPDGPYVHVDGLRQEKILDWTVKFGQLHAQAQALGIEFAGDQTHLDSSVGPLTVEQDFSDFVDLRIATAGLLARYLDNGTPQFSPVYYDIFRRRIDKENLRKLKARELEKQLAEAQARPNVPATSLQSLKSALGDLAKRQIARIAETLNTPAFEFSLGETAEFAERLLGLGRLLEAAGKSSTQNVPGSIRALQANVNLAELQTFQLQILPAFTARVTLLADAQKAWWIVARVNEILLDGVEGKAERDLGLVQTAAVDAAKDTLVLGNGIFKTLRDDVRLRNQAVNIQLPGEIDIDDLYGEVLYNRETKFLRGSFGGRIEFPNLNGGFFEISNATFDSRMNLSVSANAGSLNFGAGQLRNATINLRAGRDLPFHFDGDAMMHFNIGADAAVGLSYSEATHSLTFYAKGDNLQTIRFGDHCVLFNAGLGVVLSTDHPEGQITTSGTLGLFAKHSLGTQVATDDFHLLIDHAQILYAFDGVARTGTLQVLDGALKLPDNFTAGICSQVGVTERPTIRVNSQQPITATMRLGEGHTDQQPVIDSIRFSGSLNFEDIGMRIPQLSGLAAEMCDARIDLPIVELANNTLALESLPHFHVTRGSLAFPLPPGQTNRAIIRNADFDFTSLPTGTIYLESDMKVVDLGGSFQFFVLGGQSCGPGVPATGLTVRKDQDIPVFELSGGVKLHVASDVLQNDLENPSPSNPPASADVALTACAQLTLREDALPDLSFPVARLDGNFRLGGGVAIRNAYIALSNLNNIFLTNRAPQNPFTIALGGTILLPNGPGFGLKDCAFVFNNLKPEIPGLPQFVPGTLIYDGSQWELMRQYSFLQVDSATLTFKNGTNDFPQILSPTNLIITTTARVAIPPGDPIIGGGVNDLAVTFGPNGVPIFSLDGVGFDLQPGKLKIPPINDLGGRLYIGGLSDPINHPERLFFAGKVTGTYSEMKLGFLAAFKTTGPIGLCLDVKGGSLGIPLPFGFTISGGAGGISLVSNNADPCEMRAYIDSQTGKPTNAMPDTVSPITWPQFKNVVAELEDRARRLTNSVQRLPFSADTQEHDGSVHALNESPSAINCPEGCPPFTVNIFCQPHPTMQGRVIVKFSSIEEGTLKFFGITRDHIAELLANGLTTAGAIGTQIAVELRTQISRHVPVPPAGSEAAPLFNTLFDSIQNGFATAIGAALASSGGTADEIYARIRDTAYAGLPCPDVTYKVAGTFTHSAIGMFLSMTGDALLSTTGTAGVSGRVNFLGLPVGTGKVFIAATDEYGDPNPSLCGEVKITLGPLDIGVMSAALHCDGCISGVAEIFANFVLGLSQDVIRPVLDQVAPEYRDLSPEELVSRLKPELKTAFLAALLQNSAQALAPDLTQRFIDATTNALPRINPEFVMCGAVQPRLFGIPLGPELADAKYRLSKHGRQGLVGFAPSEIVCLIMDPRFCAPVDKATLGYNEPFPNFDAAIIAGLDGTLFDPVRAAAFAKEQVRSLLENVTMTATYELAPLGLKLARAQGRALMPDFTDYPSLRAWRRPEQLGLAGLPSRTNLLQAMLRANRLGDPFWTGKAGELPALYTENDATTSLARQLLQTRSLTHDYFPHGGIIGAGYFDVPRALFEAPPQELYTVLSPSSNVLTRITAGLTYANEYLLKNTNVGQLAFYVPAPTPPILNRDPESMLASIMNFDVSNIRNGQLYPISESFLGGFARVRLLGVDLGDGSIEGVPPGNGQDAYLRGQTQISSDPKNWLKLFVDHALVNFEIRQSPTQTVEKTFTAWVTQIQIAQQKLVARQISDAQALSQTLNPFLDALYSQLPKAKLEARLDNIHFPTNLQPFLQIAPSESLSLQAFSPRFDPSTPGDSPSALARRNGGIVMKGNLSFGNFITVPNSELEVSPKPYDPLGTTVPPDLAAELSITNATLPGGMQVKNGVLSLNTAVPRLKVSGKVTGIDLPPLVQIVPLDGAADLGASIDFQLSGSTFSTTASINPAKLLLPILSPERVLIVHGTTTNDPFTFSSSAPWSANVTLRDQLPLEFKAGTDVLFQLARSNVTSMTLQRDSNGVVSLFVKTAAGSRFTFFPGKPIQQFVRYGLARTVTVGTDGTLSVSGSIDENLTFGSGLGLPITQIGRTGGAVFERVKTSATAFDTRLVLTGSASGGVLPAGSIALNARVTLSLLNGPDLSGSVFLPPLNFGKFTLAPVGPATFSANLLRSGVVLSTGTARLVYDSAPLCEFPLSSTKQPLVLPEDVFEQSLARSSSGLSALNFTLPASGDFGFSINADFNLFNFPLGKTSFSFGRTNGIATVTINSSQLAVDLGDLPLLDMSGTLSSDGSFTLNNKTTIAPLSVGKLSPVAEVGNANALLRRQLQNGSFITEFVLSGSLSGGVLDTVNLSSSATGQFTVRSLNPSPGLGALAFSGTARLQPFVVPNSTAPVFILESFKEPTEPISATLDQDHLTVAGAQLRVPGIFDQTFGIDSFTISTEGDFSNAVGPVDITIPIPNTLGFSLGEAQFTLQRNAGVWSLARFKGTLILPGLTAQPIVTGDISSDGSFTLSSAATKSFDTEITGWAVAALNNATATLQRHLVPARNFQTWETIIILSGDASGGALGQASFVDSPRGQINLNSTGIAGGKITLNALEFPSFRLESADSNALEATLEKSRLRFSNHAARLRFNGSTVASFNLPSTAPFLLPTIGDFGFDVNNVGFTLFNVGLNGAFRFGASSGIIGLRNINGGVSYPVVGSLNFTGRVTANETILTATPSFNLGKWSVQGAKFHLDSNGLGGSGSLQLTNQFQVLEVPLNFTALSSSGLSFSGSLKDRDTKWQQEIPGIEGRLIYSISASGLNFNDSTLELKINGTMGGFVDAPFTKPPDDITKTPFHITIQEISTETPSISIPVPDAWDSIKSVLSAFSFGLW